MALQGTRALEAWCRKVTMGYQGVNILNMTTSWRSGLGFCAIIHHFCPELIDFASLDPDDVFGNNELAFSVAEQHLGIPSLLDPQDMVECELLDRLSILTYLAQYFQAFNSSSVQTRVRRLGAISKSSSTSSDLADGGTARNTAPPIAGRGNDPCRQCGEVVEIISRLNVGGRILHRTCFKCARCSTQLSLASYYETAAGDFCCEVCPDEERKEAVTLRQNKDLATLMSGDSGHSSSEEEADQEEEEVVEDLTVISGPGHTVTLEQLEASTDCNANVEEEEEERSSFGEAVEEGSPGEMGEVGDNEVTENEESLVNENNNDTNPSNETVQDLSEEFTSKLSLNNNEREDDETAVDTVDANQVVINHIDKEVVEEVAETENEYPDEINPFGDDEEEDIPPIQASVAIVVEESKEAKSKEEKEDSTNPFGSDIDSEEEGEASKPPRPATSPRPNSSLNPFGSDLSEEEGPSPSPSHSARSTLRKKRRAPLPPGVTPTPAPRLSLHGSPSTTPRGGTAKRLKDADNLHRRSQIMESIQSSAVSSPVTPAHSSIAEDAVSVISDTTSLRSSAAPRSSQLSVSMFSNMGPDKAEEGEWRKKKGPAPARPIPPKRTVKKLARKAINQELTDIEVKQGELERQGVKLERSIREICAASDAEEGANRDSLGPEAEDLIIQLFDLVNEKNELFRRQTELIYMKKDNRLEEQHADCEYQIRVLMSKPECQRTEDDKKKEDRLISKLVEIVGNRNEIVDCLEMDRLRELDEDTAIEDHMSSYAAVKPVVAPKKGGLEKILRIKKKKKKDKDHEKDVDTSEMGNLEAKSEKPKKKSAKKKILSLASKGLATSKQLAFLPHKN